MQRPRNAVLETRRREHHVAPSTHGFAVLPLVMIALAMPSTGRAMGWFHDPKPHPIWVEAKFICCIKLCFRKVALNSSAEIFIVHAPTT